MALEIELPASQQPASGEDTERKKSRWMAAGGIFAAIGASSCCILPLVLFSLGISGAWVGNLTALAPIKPYFITLAVGFLGYGFYLVYRKPKCVEGEMCARVVPSRMIKLSLWGSTAIIITAIFWTWIAPVVAPIMLGF